MKLFKLKSLAKLLVLVVGVFTICGCVSYANSSGNPMSNNKFSYQEISHFLSTGDACLQGEVVTIWEFDKQHGEVYLIPNTCFTNEILNMVCHKQDDSWRNGISNGFYAYHRHLFSIKEEPLKTQIFDHAYVVKTDSKGRFLFSDIPEGNYFLMFCKHNDLGCGPVTKVRLISGETVNEIVDEVGYGNSSNGIKRPSRVRLPKEQQ